MTRISAVLGSRKLGLQGPLEFSGDCQVYKNDGRFFAIDQLDLDSVGAFVGESGRYNDLRWPCRWKLNFKSPVFAFNTYIICLAAEPIEAVDVEANEGANIGRIAIRVRPDSVSACFASRQLRN